MYTSRGLFTQLLRDIPELSSHLAKDAMVVADKDFEKAIEKIQGENEADLKTAEKKAVALLLRADTSDSDSDSDRVVMNLIVRMDTLIPLLGNPRMQSTGEYLSPSMFLWNM